MKNKYGVQFTTTSIVDKVDKLFGKGSGTDCAVKITLA